MDLSTLAKKPRGVNGRTLLDARDSGARADISGIQLELEALSNEFHGEVFSVPGAQNLFSRVEALSNDFNTYSNIEGALLTDLTGRVVDLETNSNTSNSRLVSLESHWSGNTLMAPTV